jgi:hypothetical protein
MELSSRTASITPRRLCIIVKLERNRSRSGSILEETTADRNTRGQRINNEREERVQQGRRTTINCPAQSQSQSQTQTQRDPRDPSDRRGEPAAVEATASVSESWPQLAIVTRVWGLVVSLGSRFWVRAFSVAVWREKQDQDEPSAGSRFGPEPKQKGDGGWRQPVGPACSWQIMI